jgi:hypothetical protein
MKKIGFIAYVSIAVIFAFSFTYIGLQSRGLDPNKEGEDNPLTKAYQNLDAPIIHELENRSWEQPPPQRDDDEGNWLYEVFTPPKIYVEKIDGQEVFTAKAPNVGEAPPPPPPEFDPPAFGVALNAVYRPPFRVLVRAVSGNRDDPSKTLVLLEYLEIPLPAPGMVEASILGRKPLRGVIGKFWDEEKIRIQSHGTVDVTVNGLSSKKDKVTIADYTTLNPETSKPFTIDIMTGTTPVPGLDVYVTLVPTGNPGSAPLFLKNPQVGYKFKMTLKDSRGEDYEAFFTLTEFTESPPNVSLQKEYKWLKTEGKPLISGNDTESLSMTPGALPAPASSLPSSSSPGTQPPPALPGSMPIPSGTPPPASVSSGSLPFPFPAAPAPAGN